MTKCRLLVGDTDPTWTQLEDEEIYFVLSAQPVVNFAAADCADLLSAKYARQITSENSELRLTAAARHKHYADLAERLRKNGPGETPGGAGAGLILGGVYAGGTNKTNNEALDDGTNVPSPFGVGQDDFPTASVDPTDYFTGSDTDD